MKQFLGKVKFWMDKFLSIACAVLLEYMHMDFGVLPIAYAIGWLAMLVVEIPWVHRFMRSTQNLFEEH